MFHGAEFKHSWNISLPCEWYVGDSSRPLQNVLDSLLVNSFQKRIETLPLNSTLYTCLTSDSEWRFSLSLTSPFAGAPSGPDQSSCWRLQGRPAADSLRTEGQLDELSSKPTTQMLPQNRPSATNLFGYRAVRALQTSCRSKSQHRPYRTLHRQNRWINVVLVQLTRGKLENEDDSHSRVSNTDRLQPGLNVSDSWKRIFPGTSMSNRWIFKRKVLRDEHRDTSSI